MPRIFGTVTSFNFDAPKYTAAVKAQMEVNFRQAARAFLRAAIPLVPVQSGMARGSFLNIGRFLRVAVPISPKVTGRKYYPPGGGNPIPKTPESGASLTTAPQANPEFKGNKLTFEIDTKVFHYTLEDIIGVQSPTAPWKSFEAGRNAFMESLRVSRSKLPSIAGFITRTTITFGRGSPIRTETGPIRIRKQETNQ